MTMSRLGHRPVNNWGDGDLPAPYAEGDTIRVPDGARALDRMHGMGPGRYRVVYATSIDEGDAWYFRLAPRFRAYDECSDRLHVAYADRSATWCAGDVDWLAGCELVKTADPDGLALRERMLAEGWAAPKPWVTCPTCGRLGPPS